MDFKKLLGKLDEISPAASKPEAEKIKTAPKTALTEDAQIRVLAGVSSILEEGRRISDRKTNDNKKMEGAKALDTEDELDEVFDADAKPGDKKKTSSGVATKTATGLKHEKTYAKDDSEDEDSGKKKTTKESFRAKFNAMVESKKDESNKKKVDAKKKKMEEGSKPDFLDIDGDGDKKEPMKKAAADKKTSGNDKGSEKKGMSDKQAKYFGKKNEDVKEEADMKVGDKKKSSTGGTIEKTKTGVKHTSGKNYGGKAAEDEAKKSKKDESVVSSKKVVAESVEQRMSFKQCLQLVKESGGQQQIDPVDGELWKWAQRVASSKVEESAERDAMAAFVYERMGGDFQLYDVLSED
jgi:hypothetical protein